jgi:hypothetical protein
MESVKARIREYGILLLLSALFCSVSLPAISQPIVDTVKALQKSNERYYKTLQNMDDAGESYSFTNVIQWKIDDPELSNKIRDALDKEPFNLKKEEFDVTSIYVFSAPVAGDKVEPFHILVKGFRKEAKKGGKKGSGLGTFAEEDEGSGGAEVPVAFKGKNVIRLFKRNAALYDDLNTTQGETVELPGEIIPTGAQLVKNTQMRYALSRMFEGFYSKRVILDAQRALYGLPTSDGLFQEYKFADATNETLNIAPEDDPSGYTVDSALTNAGPQTPENVPLYAKISRDERLIDLSADHLNVNASRNITFSLSLGNPEVGLPFWTSGQGQFSVIMKNMIGTESNFRLGLAFPVSVFGEDFGKNDELLWKARRMSGGFGASVSAYFAGIDFFSAFNLPIAFNFTINPGGADSNKSIIKNGEETAVFALDGTPVTLAEGKTFYRTSFIGQLYIPTIMQLDLNSFLQVSVGIGLHNVQQSYIPTKNDVDPRRTAHPIFDAKEEGKTQDLRRVSVPVNPHIFIEYVNHRSSKFGLGVGYDHLFTVKGWIEIINDRLRIETSYSSAFIRDPKPWEPDNFFQITPRIYF